jgi:hypothetical protein
MYVEQFSTVCVFAESRARFKMVRYKIGTIFVNKGKARSIYMQIKEAF